MSCSPAASAAAPVATWVTEKPAALEALDHGTGDGTVVLDEQDLHGCILTEFAPITATTPHARCFFDNSWKNGGSALERRHVT